MARKVKTLRERIAALEAEALYCRRRADQWQGKALQKEARAEQLKIEAREAVEER